MTSEPDGTPPPQTGGPIGRTHLEDHATAPGRWGVQAHQEDPSSA